LTFILALHRLRDCARQQIVSFIDHFSSPNMLGSENSPYRAWEKSAYRNTENSAYLKSENSPYRGTEKSAYRGTENSPVNRF
jgi:hypothetical protein